MTRLLDVQSLNYSVSPERRSLFARRQRRKVLQDVSFSLDTGETLGIIGSSGSGKSTLAKLITGILKPDSGTVKFHDQQTPENLVPSHAQPSRIQMVFQDPRSALDPRQTIENIVAEPLYRSRLRPEIRRARVLEALSDVAMPADTATRYPHMFSGGQRQRIAIARALVTRPQIIVADEAVSALDVSTQAVVLNLFIELQTRFNLSYVFISHDLSVVRHVSHRVAVLDRGRIVETGETQKILNSPNTAAARALVDASY